MSFMGRADADVFQTFSKVTVGWRICAHSVYNARLEGVYSQIDNTPIPQRIYKDKRLKLGLYKYATHILLCSGNISSLGTKHG